MADYQPVQESDLETGPTPSAGVVGSAVPTGYQPVNDNDLAPGGPVPGQTSEFAYKGIPAAAAKRFSQSNPLANIFGAAATAYTNNVIYNFNSMNAAGGEILKQNGYGDYSGPGALLQHAADAFNSGFVLAKNGILAGISAIPAAGGAIEGQIIRETGGTETEAQRGEREGEFATMAALSDVGTQHGMAIEGAAKANIPRELPAGGGGEPPGGGGGGGTPEEAAKAAADEAKQVAASQAQAAAPGIWGHAYRVDGTPDGDLTQVPLGRLPTADEAKGQAATVAQALHLPPDTATLIHQTYLDTGRPPAEVLMDAQTNHGGVLDDLVAGKVPTAYQQLGRPMTPEELAAARPPADDTGPGGGAGVIGPEPMPTAGGALKGETFVPTEPGTSRVGKSIEARALDAKLIDNNLPETAGYSTIQIKALSDRVAGLINDSPDKAVAILKGDEPLPDDLQGPAQKQAFVNGMELWMHENKRGDLAGTLANSPLIRVSSEAGQTLRVARERAPDSPAAIFQDLQAAKEKAIGPKEVTARTTAVKPALREAKAGDVFLPKEELSINKFLDEIAC